MEELQHRLRFIHRPFLQREDVPLEHYDDRVLQLALLVNRDLLTIEDRCRHISIPDPFKIRSTEDQVEWEQARNERYDFLVEKTKRAITRYVAILKQELLLSLDNYLFLKKGIWLGKI